MVQTPEEIARLMAPLPQLGTKPDDPSRPDKRLIYEPHEFIAPRPRSGSPPPPDGVVDVSDPCLQAYIDDRMPSRTIDEIRADIQKFIKSQRQTKLKK